MSETASEIPGSALSGTGTDPRAAAPARLIHADVLRLTAMLAVVVLHVSARALVKAPAYGELWWAGNVCDSLSRWSVPVFVMLSGALLLGSPRPEPVLSFMRRRFGKILIPLLGWGAIYLSFRVLILHESLGAWKILQEVLAGPMFYHLWFMYVLIGLYLVTPLLRRLVSAASPGELNYFLALWLLLSCLLPMSGALLKLPIGIPAEFVGGFVGYFLLGQVLSRQSPPPRPWLLAGFGFGTGLTIWGTWALTLRKQGLLDQLLYSYFSPNVVLMAVTIFWLFQGIRFAPALAASPWLRQLSGASFGIYLCHPLLLALALNTPIRSFRLDAILHGAWWGIPAVSLLIYLMALAMTLVMQRVPWLRAIVP